MKTRIIFIIGTDTGVGKTVMTAHLLHHLLQRKVKAGVLKPFCSGGRGDALCLADVIGSAVDLDTINPFHFQAPLTPLVAARNEQRSISLEDCVSRVRDAAQGSEVLLVEGAGGLLSPLGEGFDALDMIEVLGAVTVLVAPNRLGVLNQVFLNLRLLEQRGCMPAALVLMGMENPDESAASNPGVIAENWPALPVHELAFLGPEPVGKAALEATCKKMEKTLAGMAGRP